MLSNIRFIAAAFSLTVATMAAHAGQISYEELSTDAKLVTFETQPLNFGRPGPVFSGGLTFTSGNGSFRTYPSGSIELCESGCIMTDVELDYISVALPTPAAQAGGFVGVYNVPNHAQVEFYSNDLLLGTIAVDTAANEGKFAGWDAGQQLITSVRFVDVEDQQFTITLGEFAYSPTSTVPEPSNGFLFAVGILALLALRKGKLPQ
ncbi:PEP-CTERM sorting domain-containing protein [Methyloversatilis sp. XJ19-13]|uniref:PEP-CTERM sorting domain-containing protein n=1 Tax=Methyloversatilis sp. XJ19-13 TaxID=2963430 RepID=UPI00211CD395|nr:PEP-CTERM sorting domain-containing protein [Methyloversatilis sp. XJ19-13]MCQ9375477.1 PEP-CTERM sorting domain-containing protein [Methyloversatilis sp. XJ19-13]